MKRVIADLTKVAFAVSVAVILGARIYFGQNNAIDAQF